MNIFQLVFKQMRQRALGTWLTVLSVMLGMALAVAVFLMLGAGEALFGQTEYGYDVLVGIGEGSATQLVMNTVYHIDKSPGNVPYWIYEAINNQERPPRGSTEFNFSKRVRTAIPIAVGDTYKSRPIVGTPPKMFLSVAPLKQKFMDLSEQLHKILLDTQANAAHPPADLATRQKSASASLTALKQEMQEFERQSTPFVEIGSDNGKWLYGKPAVLDLDKAIDESNAAEAAVLSGNGSGAFAHQQAAETAVDAVVRAIGFEGGPLDYKPDANYEIADGRVFHAWKFEAVIGSEVAQKTGLKIGDHFQATHGNPGPNEIPDIHAEHWKVVGILKTTHTAADRCLYIPLISFYCIAEHEKGLKEQAQVQQGRELKARQPGDEGPPPYTLVYGDQLDPSLPHEKDYISVSTPKQDWEISAIMIKSRGGVSGGELTYFIANRGLPGIQAVSPAQVMQQFFDTFFRGSTLVLEVIALLVSIVAAVGILVGIYNSISARKKEIAILRALGATRTTILGLICMEAGMIGLFGGILGMILGHALGAVASAQLNERVGQGFNWRAIDAMEWRYLAIVVIIALIAGLVPGLKAYRTPVATNLTAE